MKIQKTQKKTYNLLYSSKYSNIKSIFSLIFQRLKSNDYKFKNLKSLFFYFSIVKSVENRQHGKERKRSGKVG